MYSLKYGIFGYRMTEVYEKVKWRVSQISVMAVKYNDKIGSVVLGVWLCCLGSFLFSKFWLLCLWQIMAYVPRISFSCTCFLCSLCFFFNQSLLVSVKGRDRSTRNLYVIQAGNVSVVTLQVEQRALSHAVAASRACGGGFGMVLL